MRGKRRNGGAGLWDPNPKNHHQSVNVSGIVCDIPFFFFKFPITLRSVCSGERNISNIITSHTSEKFSMVMIAGNLNSILFNMET